MQQTMTVFLEKHMSMKFETFDVHRIIFEKISLSMSHQKLI